MHAHGNFAFHHIPKTGGTSVIKLLHLTGKPFKIVSKSSHEPLSSRRGRKNLKKFKYIYTNIRDPFARIVSLYEFSGDGGQRNKFREGCTCFKEFFYDKWYPNTENRDWFRSTEEFIVVDGKIPEKLTIVKLEEIDEVWPKIITKHFGKRVLMVPRENTTIHDEPMLYFDEEMIEKVKQKEGWVLEYYNL